MRIIKNEVYTGWIVKFGQRTKGQFEPLVSEDSFAQVQRVIKYRGKQVKKYTVENPDFPLRRFVKNASGEKVTGGWSRGRSKKYAYYYFANPKLSIKREYLETAYMEFLNGFRLNNVQFERLKTLAIQHLEKSIKTKAKIKKEAENYVAELKEKQHLLIQKNLSGIISDTLARE